jgi:DNA invertase Pin-like site-specific DNA recombinase
VRLVGYSRVSTRGQVKAGASIPYQDREIRAWARRNGHRIVGMFPEEGRSGALDLEDRAALTAAIDLIATRKAGGLVYYSLDRLARRRVAPDDRRSVIRRHHAVLALPVAGLALKR